MKLKNKYAIGCLVQWYEIEIFEEYLESLMNALKDIDNKENVIVDIFFNMAQNLEQIDEEQMKLDEIFQRFLEARRKLTSQHINYNVGFYPESIEQAVQNILSKGLRTLDISNDLYSLAGDKIFNLDDRDCTMVIESYGQCQDFPCTDCVYRIHKEINNGTLEI